MLHRYPVMPEPHPPDPDRTRPHVDRAPAAGAPGIGPPAEPGEVGTLGPYRLQRELGRGGMGAVYAAVDTRLGRRVALKLLLPEFAADPDARGRFVREARAAAGVHHDNVVTVFEADERDGVPYIAMPLLAGESLDDALKRPGPPALGRAVRVAREAALGLAAAHARGLVHRDIKPGNLWLEAPHGRVKVLDFGLARPAAAADRITRDGAVLGTPAYMSPEQARGAAVDHRTDLFSLGVVLYRLCTGRLPFTGSTPVAVLIALASESPPPVRGLNPSVPPSLAALIHQLLAKSPADRPYSADEVAARLAAVGEPAALPEVNPFADLTTPAAPRPAARLDTRGWIAVGVGVLALLTLGGIGLIVSSCGSADPTAPTPFDPWAGVLKDGPTGPRLKSVR